MEDQKQKREGARMLRLLSEPEAEETRVVSSQSRMRYTSRAFLGRLAIVLVIAWMALQIVGIVAMSSTWIWLVAVIATLAYAYNNHS